MKKFLVLSSICILAGFLMIGCQREQGVQAANEQNNTGTYQPRPAPKGEVEQKPETSGELQRVDMAGRTFIVRVDDGMEQTFKFDENTTVMGLENQPAAAGKTGKVSNRAVRNLVGKEGSEVTVQWQDQDGAKVATDIDVTQVSSSKSARPVGKGRAKRIS